VKQIEFRFYEELNDFLPPALRKRSFEHHAAAHASVKHAIEALGVPHTEVELVLVNGVSVGFAHRLRDHDRVSVYPKFEALDISPLLRVRATALRETRFIADAHLGRLARYLRFLGYDTLYRNAWQDVELVAIAQREHRIVLTRDRALLMRREVTHGCFVHPVAPLAQLRQVVERTTLDTSGARPRRCMLCNLPLESVDADAVRERVPAGTRSQHRQFWTCPGCDRVYWRGSHWHRLLATMQRALAPG
jgi:uncharacterized protein with PIN domain